MDEEHLALFAVGKGNQPAAEEGFNTQPAAEAPAILAESARVALAGADFKRVDILHTGLREELRHVLPAFRDAAVPAGLVKGAFTGGQLALDLRRKQGDGLFRKYIRGGGIEMIMNFPAKQRHPAANRQGEQRFARAVGAQNSPLFAALPGPASVRKSRPTRTVPPDGNLVEGKQAGIGFGRG